jgi:hypothetical protein
MAQATQDPGGFRAAVQGLATALFGASAPDIKGRRAWPRPLARRGPWRGLRQRRRSRVAAQRIQRDSAPHCSWSSTALCWAEETGTRRQERTGWAAASRNQIRAQAGSRPGACCSMPTELMEEGMVMAA